jgi:hypothetical protein
MAEIVTKGDIENYLDSQNDFDLELWVYRYLVERGLPAEHGGSYVDPYSGKARQFDVRATANLGAPLDWAVSMAIECKSLSTAFPLVVSRTPRADSESYHNLIVANAGAQADQRIVAWEPKNTPSRFFRIGEYVGKKTSQVSVDVDRKTHMRMTSGNDKETFNKWDQAIASASGLLHEVIGSSRYQNRSLIVATFIVPILVVSDGTLWTVDYDDKWIRSEPQLADETTLFVQRSHDLPYPTWEGTYRISHLLIFTKTGFAKFIADLCVPHSQLWDRIFAKELA